jgi:arginine repressor
MTTLELAKILKVTQRTVSLRCQKLGLQRHLVNGKWKYFLSAEQAKTISNLSPEVEKIISEKVEVIYVHTIFHIYPSKLNYLKV